MKFPQVHTFPNTIEEATALQETLRHQVTVTDDLPPIRFVAGADVGFPDGGINTRAAVVVLSFPELKLVESVSIIRPTTFPYIPGFLSFREIPAILEALEKLKTLPDLILCDGQGIAHPRRLGIACHLGVITNIPTIGAAKSLLMGKHEPVEEHRGAWKPLIHQGETIGAVLRTRDKVRPLYISSGYRISLPTAIDYVLRCTPKYRLPETTRLADKLASGLPIP